MPLSKEDVEQRLITVMAAEPMLCDNGIGVFDPRSKTAEQRAEELKNQREVLVNSIDDIVWTTNWLIENIRPTKTINKKRDSYGLKHIAEMASPNKYLTNGVFIAAAMIADYRYKIEPGSPNPFFGMNEVEIKALRERLLKEKFGA